MRDLFRWYGKNSGDYASLRSVARAGLYQSRKTGVSLLRPDMRGAYFRMGKGENQHAQDLSLLYLDGLYLTPQLAEGATTSMTLLPPQRFGPPELCYPEVESGLPGVVSRSYGKGRTVFLAAGLALSARQRSRLPTCWFRLAAARRL